MESDNDEDTIEFDIEVIDSSSSISLDQDLSVQNIELNSKQLEEAVSKHQNQEDSKLCQIVQDSLIHQDSHSLEKRYDNDRNCLSCSRILIREGFEQTELRSRSLPDLEVISERHGSADWSWKDNEITASQGSVDSSSGDIENIKLKPNNHSSSNSQQSTLCASQILSATDKQDSNNHHLTRQQIDEEVKSNKTSVRVTDDLDCNRSVINEKPEQNIEQTTNLNHVEPTQWFECLSVDMVILDEIVDCLVELELQEALLQFEFLPTENQFDADVVGCLALPGDDSDVIKNFELNEESLVDQKPQQGDNDLSPPGNTELTQSESKDAEDLEQEFDEEPTFVEHKVELKINQNVRSNYALSDELGRGKFGTVFKCVETASGRMFAAKFVQLRRSEDRDDVMREIDIMSRLQHKRLLQLYDAYDDGAQEMCLITELVEGGELFERIVNDDFELTEKKAAIFVRQICEGVCYMHSQDIVHLDMKPENILCVSKTSNRIKLIDFGLARRLQPDQPLRVMFGTPDFAAPEVLAYDTVSFATDMWSVGVICYVLLSGLSPFMGDTDMETMANVTRAIFDFDDQAFDPISDLAKDFISRLLVKEQDRRMHPDDCLSHPWLMRGGAQLESAARGRRLSMALDLQVQQQVHETAQTQVIELDIAGLPLSLDKRNLKKYVIRRKWHKTVHAIMALGRMGANLRP